MNADWHAAHPMRKRTTTEQRIAWHIEHEKHCACRPMPDTLRALVRRSGGTSEANALRPLLAGGDRRSIAQSNRVRAMVGRHPRLVADLAALTSDGDWLVSMRAMDLLEKLAHEHPDWIEPHKRAFIGPLADSDKWEIRLQIVRALPLFTWSPNDFKRVQRILLENVDVPQTFVRAWALDSLATLAEWNRALMPAVRRGLAMFERSGSTALSARARKIRERLKWTSARPPREVRSPKSMPRTVTRRRRPGH
jgi:hypothetical protein